MNAIWSSIAIQIAWAVLEPLLLTAVTAAVSWAVVRWHRMTGYQIEASHRDALHKALGNGVKAGLQALKAQRGYSLMSDASDPWVLEFAQHYVEARNPDTVRRLGLTPEVLRELAVPHLPLPASFTMPSLGGQK
ncbi:hypothetical protein EMQ25_05800 [Arsenicitalea aurantiaca]|uniref:Uncharacterized protein n=1 Tax=Arsenicitalea aurantiaca TaxID=1783274 RepID=A0A433XEX7_9HYPH|nr:hypothetical protein [Arsenicitalea aurantiaca]RUT32659.1 hypothetical protein EMQ25_05800 [Arsenicitalea aurantiaca]